MFNIFRKFGRKHFLGVDFGTSSVKVVELSIRNQKPHLENYSWAYFNAALANQDTNEMTRDELMKISLQKVVKKMKPVSGSAYISVPAYTGLITIFELPYMEKDELEQAIKFEMHKYIPASEEEIIVSWDVIRSETDNSPGSGTKRVKILLVAAMKEEISRYEKIMKAVKIDVKAAELETFSIVRSLVGDDQGTYLIVDIGFRACNVILAEKGVIKISRNIDTGGNDITKSVAESFNVSWEKAENIKKQQKDLINNKESGVIVYSLELIIDEMRRILESKKSENSSGGKVDGIIISGGSANMKGLTEYISNALGIRAIVGNPWKKIVFDEKLKSKMEAMGLSFSVAVGLALRGIEEQKNK